MTWSTPKTNYTTSDPLTYGDLNRAEENIDVVKDSLVAHGATTHNTIAERRTNNSTLRIESRVADPTTPATGRIWII